MGLHLCPIEPYDWGNGPDEDSDSFPRCRRCKSREIDPSCEVYFCLDCLWIGDEPEWDFEEYEPLYDDVM